MTTGTPWITVVGIGDDGLDGLSPATRALIDGADLLVGGDRHQAMVPVTRAERLTWACGLTQAMDAIESWRGRRVVVLATGDPMCYGAGANLARRFRPEEMRILPFPGAFTLAAARMGWSLPDVATLTVHGRPLEILALHLAPGARLLVLSRDGKTPAQAAALLTDRGYGPSTLTVLEHLGGPRERRIDGIADTWSAPRGADLNTLAIRCRLAHGARPLARVPGLPDDAFENDGQLTKQAVRAATLAALAPLPGQLMWDVGSGSGSIAIEWLRSLPDWRLAARGAARAIAIERSPERCRAIAGNAARLGVPQLQVVEGEAPAILATLAPAPDSVFVGGGVATPGLLEACWHAVASGGRLVANAVTIEGAARLFAFANCHGGELSRIAVARAEPVGRLTAFRAQMEVTQLTVLKPGAPTT
ncbi:MAG: precorrin-6y C5,15-methyltransferase (decarboxylating) subunit CbiE [Rhodospirillales bacterium]|nr:MAG: precorrin-6y C5,15-methyltransferase (decarboxylating) subunit CbiE [Rhodospirillales bacterium]